MKIGILYSQNKNNIENWIIACEKKSIEYEVFDLCSVDCLDRILKSDIDFFVQRPEGDLEYVKSMYDEKLYIITKILNKKVFPSYEESLIYENKKLLSYFLKVKNILHAKTDVFYYKEEAREYIENVKFPIVAKTTIGASGSGVEILKNYKQANGYIKKAFGKKGITRRFGPNPSKGNMKIWIKKSIKDPMLFVAKLNSYIRRNKSGQKNFVIFQEYIEHEFEWRVTKCGNYYYAYQKLKLFGKCSGSGIGGHDIEPPMELLDYVRHICEENNFVSMAVDILSSKDNRFRINEMQTHWGVDHDDCMFIDNKKGIYKYENGWQFIEGDFWQNDYFDMRLDVALDYFKF